MKKLMVILFLVAVSCWLGCEKEYDGFPETQDSNCAWEVNDRDFVEGLCGEYGIDFNDYYRISCPKCIVDGAFIERRPDGSVMAKFYYPMDGQVYCSECGYPIGHDWQIYKIDSSYGSIVQETAESNEPNEYIEPNNFPVPFPGLNKAVCFRIEDANAE